MTAQPGDILYDYITDRNGGLKIVKTQDVEPILKTVHFLPDAMSKRKYLKSNNRYMGSIPSVIGLQWAEEAGVRYLSREWKEVAVRKLKTPEFSKLKLRF